MNARRSNSTRYIVITLSTVLSVTATVQAQDCNANGIPDATDIANGTSTDCNGNGIPDECDLATGVTNIFSDPLFASPIGVTQDAATGDFIVIDQGKRALFRVTAGGAGTTIASGPPFSQPVGVTQDAATGDFIVTDQGNGTLFRVSGPVSTDCNVNGVPDECEPGVPLDIPRFVGVLTGTNADPVDACLADVNGDGGTDGLDVQLLLNGLLGP